MPSPWVDHIAGRRKTIGVRIEEFHRREAYISIVASGDEHESAGKQRAGVRFALGFHGTGRRET